MWSLHYPAEDFYKVMRRAVDQWERSVALNYATSTTATANGRCERLRKVIARKPMQRQQARGLQHDHQPQKALRTMRDTAQIWHRTELFDDQPQYRSQRATCPIALFRSLGHQLVLSSSGPCRALGLGQPRRGAGAQCQRCCGLSKQGANHLCHTGAGGGAAAHRCAANSQRHAGGAAGGELHAAAWGVPY